MNTNVSFIERIIRVAIGAALIAFALIGPKTGFDWVGWIGIIPLVTGLIGWCPIYTLFRSDVS